MPRTPCTLWCPSGAWVRVGSLSRTSAHRPSATSHTRRSREPSAAPGCEYFRLVLERDRAFVNLQVLNPGDVPRRPLT